jgi:hypothetical protein
LACICTMNRRLTLFETKYVELVGSLGNMFRFL